MVLNNGIRLLSLWSLIAWLALASSVAGHGRATGASDNCLLSESAPRAATGNLLGSQIVPLPSAPQEESLLCGRAQGAFGSFYVPLNKAIPCAPRQFLIFVASPGERPATVVDGRADEVLTALYPPRAP